MPVTSIAVGEDLCLPQPVLPGRGVNGQQRLVRRLGDLLGDHAADLGQLPHQIILGMQPARGVDDHDIGALPARGCDRLIGDRTRVGPSGPRTNVTPARSAHTLELLDRGGAERVGGGKHDPAPQLLD